MAIPLLGYGSLMSGFGLRRLGHLRARRVRRVELLNARRGFGKASQHGDRYAMVLEPIVAARSLAARPLSPTQRGGAVQGILVDLEMEDLARVGHREGYAAAALERLAARAFGAGRTLPSYLLATLGEAGGEIARYRGLLRQRAGYTSGHYIPHPVEIEGDTPALTFLAPGAEGSGDPAVIPVRVATGRRELLDIVATWRLKHSRAQLDYFAMCLLAAAHGVRVDDIAAPLAGAAHLLAPLREVVRACTGVEIDSLCSALGLSTAAYCDFAGPTDLLYSQLFST
jgi:hypothetical protein